MTGWTCVETVAPATFLNGHSRGLSSLRVYPKSPAAPNVIHAHAK